MSINRKLIASCFIMVQSIKAFVFLKCDNFQFYFSLKGAIIVFLQILHYCLYNPILLIPLQCFELEKLIGWDAIRLQKRKKSPDTIKWSTYEYFNLDDWEPTQTYARCTSFNAHLQCLSILLNQNIDVHKFINVFSCAAS